MRVSRQGSVPIIAVGVGDVVFGVTVALAVKIHVQVEKTGRATVAVQ